MAQKFIQAINCIGGTNMKMEEEYELASVQCALV
jgi:hypothetical protein